MRRWDAAIILLVMGVSVTVWAFANRPQEAVPWSGLIQGISFSPFGRDASPEAGDAPTSDQIDDDLARLDGLVTRIRTYRAGNEFSAIPGLARRYGFKVTAGAWIDGNAEADATEIAKLVRLANGNGNVDRVLVGNEALLREDVTAAELIDHLKTVRRQVKVPVSTSEPWHVWLAHPELADHVQFIAVHILPYWEGVPVDDAVAYTLDRLDEIRAAFPGKPVVLTEVGWPSGGRIRGAAVPTQVNQARFLRAFLRAAEWRKLDYFVVEAFDQPWKMAMEGGAGAYWGLFDVDRQMKVTFTGPLIPVEGWPRLAAASAYFALLPLLLFFTAARRLAGPGRLVYGGLIQAVAMGAVWAGHVFASHYMTEAGLIVQAGMTLLLAVLVAVLMTEALEAVEVTWSRPLRRAVRPRRRTLPDRAPKVSIHVPICSEPPDMVVKTLRALARLDYPNFEVLVVDNNTRDEALWRPVQACCSHLGPRFRFFHVERLAGFKAGALNFALRRTAPDAEIIGVIDSDYLVAPDWLGALVPMFGDDRVGVVQAPQDYRDGGESAFKRMCFWEYAGFFQCGMVQRNERNAIIQHGTMTLVRRAALARVGGWGEWCICEDAELGLRILAAGYDARYVAESFGRGLTPDSLAAYQKQRFRWAYGAVQIVRRHKRALLGGGPGRLSLGQRFHFIAGWLPWLADAVNLVLTGLALAWTAGLLIWPDRFEYPLSLFLAAALSFVGGKLVKTAWLYRTRMRASWADTLGAAVAGLALSHTVAKAVLAGLITRNRPFLRTPKCQSRPALLRGAAMVWQETILCLLLCGGAVAVALTVGRVEPEALLWSAMLGVLSLPHGAALTLSMINAAPAFGVRPRLGAPAVVRNG
ncbi:MAG: glycosyltransferase [Alphaproteobacteria bacterium]|nr:glycosyltransferase [Alphaproteobacteria bacterium]